MTDADLATTIDAAWEARDRLGPQSRGAHREAVEEALDASMPVVCASPRI